MRPRQNFFTNEREGLWIGRSAAHSRITEICLLTLCGSEFTPPRTCRAAGASIKKRLSPLANYAAENFAYYLMHSSATSDILLTHLNKFLRSNVLSWIEKLAGLGDLSILRQTAQRLEAYTTGLAESFQIDSKEAQTVAKWAKDIHHIVAAFHAALLTSPSSIHFLIPNLCPPASIIRQLFGKFSKRLRITGPLDEDWSDRLTCYLFSDDPYSIACSEEFLAIGLGSGAIWIYDISGFGSFEPLATLNHGKKVRQLAFNASSSLLVSCSVRKLALWDVSRSDGSFSCLWAQDINFTPYGALFSQDGSWIMLSDTYRSAIVKFATTDASRRETLFFREPSDSDSEDSDHEVKDWTVASNLWVDPCQNLVAMGYRNAVVNIWDLEAMERIGYFKRDGYTHISPPTLDMVSTRSPSSSSSLSHTKTAALCSATLGRWNKPRNMNRRISSRSTFLPAPLMAVCLPAWMRQKPFTFSCLRRCNHFTVSDHQTTNSSVFMPSPSRLTTVDFLRSAVGIVTYGNLAALSQARTGIQ